MVGYIEIMQQKLNTTFNMDDWTACKKCADTYTKNSDMVKPFPKGAYKPTLPRKTNDYWNFRR